MTEIRVVDHHEQPTAVVRQTVPMTQLPEFIPSAFGVAMAAASAQGVEITGPPFSKYYGMPTETIDVEAGFPVSRPVSDADEVIAGTLPGGAAVEAVHVGSYEGLADTYGDVERWMAENGIRGAHVVWESYVTDPGSQPDPTTWRTLIVWPIAPPG